METQQPSIKKIALNFGVLLALLSIGLQVISYVLDVHIAPPWWLSVLQMLISVGIIIMGLKAFKAANSGYLTLGQALKTGVAISLIAGVIGVIFNYFFMNYIDPDFIQKTLAASQEQMILNKPDMTQKELDMAMEMSTKFMSPLFISAFAIIGVLFYGFIISLIAGLIMKKNPPHQL